VVENSRVRYHQATKEVARIRQLLTHIIIIIMEGDGPPVQRMLLVVQARA